MGYTSLLRSFLHRFESRGESANSARFGAAVGLTIILAMNVAAVVLLLDEFAGTSLRRYLRNGPFNVSAIFVITAVYYFFLGRVQEADVDVPSEARARKLAGIHLWVWYFVTSVVFLFAAIFIVTGP